LREIKAKHPAREEARHLADVLLGSIPGLQNKQPLVIVRDGELHLVPFDALL
jgi:hypothetical protein